MLKSTYPSLVSTVVFGFLYGGGTNIPNIKKGDLKTETSILSIEKL